MTTGLVQVEPREQATIEAAPIWDLESVKRYTG